MLSVHQVQSAPCLSVELFGPIDIQIENGPLPRLHSQRGLWLLALLALRGRSPIERSLLAGMLWPESPETTALHNLRQTLADLRRALGPAASCLVADTPRTLRLDFTHVTADVVDFDQAYESADMSVVECAVKLYRGPLLAGCDEPWAIEERESRGQMYLELLERLAADRVEAEDYTAVSNWLRLAIAADPYRESAHRGLMQSLSMAGELTAAMEVYRSLRLRLHRDLNAEPDTMTTEQFQAIIARRTARVPHPPQPAHVTRFRSVPIPATQLLGRDENVGVIKDLMCRNRFVTITGVGGIGKTRLALQVAREYEDSSDNLAFVCLAALTDPSMIAHTVSTTLRATAFDAGQETIESLKQYLFLHPVLLVLDNCEHLLPECASFVDELLSHCEEVRILATSRHALGLIGETVWRTPPLALPPCRGRKPLSAIDGTDSPESFAAVELFVARARGVEDTFRITPTAAPLIVEICQQLDGIPLAIELAAARVRSLSLEEIHSRLKTGLDLLSGGGSTLLPRHKTLEAAFDWSWDLLSLPERSLLQRLAVFVGGWTLAGAEAICSGGEVAPDEIVDLLTSLVDKSLVVFVSEENGAGDSANTAYQARYHLLEPIRQFAASRLALAGEHGTLCRRHTDYLLSWAESIKPRLYGAGQEVWFDRLEADHDNLRAALRWCRSHTDKAELQIRLTVALARFWDTRGHIREGRINLDDAVLLITPDLPRDLKERVLGHAGWIAAVQKDNDAARAYYGMALNILDEVENQEARAAILGWLALVESDTGDLIGAREHLEASLCIHRRLCSGKIGSTLNNIALVDMQLGNDESARAYLEESANHCEYANNERQQLAITLCNLSEVDLRQRRYKEAAMHCSISIRISRECGALINIPDALDQMARIAQLDACWQRAARLLGAAEGLRNTMGVPNTDTNHTDVMAASESALGFDDLACIVAEGRRMSLDQAISYALADI